MYALRICIPNDHLARVHTSVTFRIIFSGIRNSSAVNSNAVREETHSDDTKENLVRLNDDEVLRARKRNKSRLFIPHRNLLNNKLPYSEPVADHHHTLNYKKRMYGLYGENSGVDPGIICWPSSDDISFMTEYENLSRPHTLQKMMSINIQSKKAEKQTLMKREYDVAKKLAKLEAWKQDLNDRIRKREADAVAAKAKRDRLIEEVRRHFGFKVDPRDERFKEMLEKKEKEEKRLAKEAKKKSKEAKLLSQLADASGKPDIF